MSPITSAVSRKMIWNMPHWPFRHPAIPGLPHEIPRGRPGPGQRVAVRPGLRIRIFRLRVGQDPCQPRRDYPQLDALGRDTIRLDTTHDSPIMICSRPGEYSISTTVHKCFRGTSRKRLSSWA